MEFYRRSQGMPRSVGVLAGSFNPPTVAHLELARAARAHVDEILCVVPRRFPHKEYFGATLEQRIAMLARTGFPEPYSIGTSERGLFVEIAGEFREQYDHRTRLYFVCGRDAAERILDWDYGEPRMRERMLGRFELLVAPRAGPFPEAQVGDKIHHLAVANSLDQVSSSEVRARIARGEPWEDMVPEPIIDQVRGIYS